jgi:hypothetical protein
MRARGLARAEGWPLQRRAGRLPKLPCEGRVTGACAHARKIKKMTKFAATQARFVAGALVAAFSFSLLGCSSESGPSGSAAAGSSSTAGAPAHAGGSGAPAGGSANGSSANGGSANGGSPSGGTAGAGGSADAGAGNSALANDCTSACAAQTKLDCSTGADCQSLCLAPGHPSDPQVKCQSEYDAMLHCDAPLAASKWMCSQDAAPVPVAGECISAVCAYACCVGALVADQDLWSRCMPSCAQ